MRLAYVDEYLAAAIGEQIEAAGGTLSTTLDRLAAVLALGVDELRRDVLELDYVGLVAGDRGGTCGADLAV